LREFVAEHPGHEVIRDHKIVLRAGEKLQRLEPVGRLGNRVPINAEQQFDGVADYRIVLHEKDVPCWSVGCLIHCHRNKQHF
jgi:hypothetical protein